MKKVLEVIKSIFAWIGAILLGLIMVRKAKKEEFYYPQAVKMTDDEIEEKCNEKRNETFERISSTDACKLAESYGGVCDKVSEGIERFKRRID